jgi:hypothetical protein
VSSESAVAALSVSNNDAHRAAVARTLYRYPASPRLVDAFVGAYKALAPAAGDAANGDDPRLAFVNAAPAYFDPKLVDWLVKIATDAKPSEKQMLVAAALRSAVVLMTAEQEAAVAAAVKRVGSPADAALVDAASAVLKKCGKDASCYVSALDQPIAAGPAAQVAAIKAATMAGVFGDDATKTQLASRLGKVTDDTVRQVAQAILHLAPAGDASIADAIAKVAQEKKTASPGASAELSIVAGILKNRTL